MRLVPDLEEFCADLRGVDGLRLVDYALAVLWWTDRRSRGETISQSDLAKVLRESGLGDGRASRIGRGLAESGHVQRHPRGSENWRLSAVGRRALDKRFESLVEPEDFTGHPYIPESLWRGGDPYIEAICGEINGCIHRRYFNAAAVLLRRLAESMVIVAFHKQQRDDEIRSQDGNYFMFDKLVRTATAPGGLPLGREAKRSLTDIKVLGDRAAHNPRVLTREEDLQKLEGGARATIEELLTLSGLGP